jgi:DNA-directed RNA polymerase subunit omega
MIYPAMSSLLEKVDSRYTLVIATAKRARMLTNGAQKLTDHQSTKDVTIAIHEIAEGKVSYHKIQKKANQLVTEGSEQTLQEESNPDSV